MRLLFSNILLVLCFTYQDAIKFRCDYRFYSPGWYKYNEMPMTWRDARLQCHLQGAMLASPATAEIKGVMLQLIDKVDVFTGIHATFSKGQFHTINGIPFDKILHTHAWAPGEPDNKDDAERCISLSSEGKFADVRCDVPRPFICYREYSTADATICGTPDTEYRLESRTNKCYKFHTKPRTFERAHFACSAEGGHLAIINSDTESTVIRELFAQYPGGKMLGNFWKDIAFIGFHNWDESTDWTTLEGQSIQDAGFAKFSGGEPNNATEGEYCGAVYRNGLLDDLWCYRHFAFICEKKPDYPPVCENTMDEGSAVGEAVY